jgi:hypothetical protein
MSAPIRWQGVVTDGQVKNIISLATTVWGIKNNEIILSTTGILL